MTRTTRVTSAMPSYSGRPLTRETFARWMVLLAERHNRPVSKALLAAYYHALCDELGEEEFDLAARILFRSFRWWPTPVDFVEAVRPPLDPRVAATRAMTALRKAVKKTSEGTRTFRAVDWTVVPEDQVAFVRAGLQASGYDSDSLTKLLDGDRWHRDLFDRGVEDAVIHQRETALRLPAHVSLAQLPEVASRTDEVTRDETTAPTPGGEGRPGRLTALPAGDEPARPVPTGSHRAVGRRVRAGDGGGA